MQAFCSQHCVEDIIVLIHSFNNMPNLLKNKYHTLHKNCHFSAPQKPPPLIEIEMGIIEHRVQSGKPLKYICSLGVAPEKYLNFTLIENSHGVWPPLMEYLLPADLLK